MHTIVPIFVRHEVNMRDTHPSAEHAQTYMSLDVSYCMYEETNELGPRTRMHTYTHSIPHSRISGWFET